MGNMGERETVQLYTPLHLSLSQWRIQEGGWDNDNYNVFLTQMKRE